MRPLSHSREQWPPIIRLTESGYEHWNAQGHRHFPEGGEEVATSGTPARVIAGFMLALAMIAVRISGAAAQESGSITINAYACEGDDCTAPAAGVDLYASVLKLDYAAEG